MGQPLLVAQLHPAEVENTVLHRTGHALAAPTLIALIERCHNAESQVQPGAGIADLSARHQRHPVELTRRRRRPARALGHILIDLAVFVRSRPEAFNGRVDHPRIDLLDTFP